MVPLLLTSLACAPLPTSVERIAQDTRWEGTVALQATVYVEPGATLTLAAGTVVEVYPRTGVYVDGAVVAEGPVRVVGVGSFGDENQGFNVGGGGSALDGLTVERVDLEVVDGGLTRLAGLTSVDAQLDLGRCPQEFHLDGATFTRDRSFDVAAVLVSDCADVVLEGLEVVGASKGVSLSGDGELSVEVVDSTFLDVGTAIYLTQDDPEVRGLARLHGVRVERAAEDGVFARGFDLSVWDSTFAEVGDDGISGGTPSTVVAFSVVVADAGADCVDADGPLELTDVVLSGCGRNGVEAPDETHLLRTRVSGAGETGVEMGWGSVTDTTVEGSGGPGVAVREGAATLLTGVRAAGNGEEGVVGRASGVLAVDLTACDIVDNASWGLREVRLVSGTHVSGNLGYGGVDLGDGGLVDGVRDTDTDQIDDADSILDPQARLVGAGAP